jgi:hypothetical protein
MANMLQEANSQHFEGLQLEGAKWLGTTEGRKTAALKVTVTDVRCANKLINNRLALNYEIFSVTKFVSAKRRGTACSPLFHVTPAPDTTRATTLQVDLTQTETTNTDLTQTDNVSRGQKRPAPGTTPDKGKRGRPSNAAGFASQQPEGENPFTITTKRNQGRTTTSTQNEEEMDTSN